jgi:hypothetical protein
MKLEGDNLFYSLSIDEAVMSESANPVDSMIPSKMIITLQNPSSQSS